MLYLKIFILVRGNSGFYVVLFILLLAIYKMGIQYSGLTSIYISFHFSHRKHKHISPPRDRNILRTLVIICSKPDQYTRSKAWVCSTILSYIKDLSSLWIFLLLRISPTTSVTLVPSILYNMVSGVRPSGVGAFFCKLAHNSDLDLMSHSIFIFL